MTDEDAFQAHLDANPDDHLCRLVFADWLEERGDPRAEGMRAMGFTGRYADTTCAVRFVYSLSRPWDECAKKNLDKSILTKSWFKAVVFAEIRFTSRRRAENAVALAFGLLTDAGKAEVMSAAVGQD